MGKKNKIINVCTECGKPTKKWRKFFGAWICPKCFKENDLQNIELAEQNNLKLF